MLPSKAQPVRAARIYILILIVLAGLLSGCQPARPISASASTVAVEIERTLVAQAPTLTPSPPPVQPPVRPDAPIQATPAIYDLSSSVPDTGASGPAIYACAVAPESAPIRKAVQARQSFNSMWLVYNTGNRDWSQQTVRYAYLRGQALQHPVSAFPLPKDVHPGKSVQLVAGMQAPDSPGNYTAFWSLTSGPDIFCTLEIQIEVAQ